MLQLKHHIQNLNHAPSPLPLPISDLAPLV
jgi:hypothetical protein